MRRHPAIVVLEFVGADMGRKLRMAEEKKRVVAIGEVMIEMSRGGDGRFGMACGGDTFNTSVYLARSGIDVAYATALGDDPHSDGILAMAAAEGINTDLVLRVPGRLPGLYMIETDSKGERRFRYWRGEAPARELFELAGWNRIAEAMVGARLIFFSGITLSLYSNTGLGRLFAIIEMARQQGAKVAFDGNFRPHGWKGDLPRARTVIMEALKRADVALPTFDDEAVLWGDPSPEATVERMQAFGIGEIVVKNGPNSALVSANGRQEFVAPVEVAEPVDTTAAGDSFNAAYMAARLSGERPAAAASAGHKLAAEKVRHRGAIMPRNAAAVH
jgi:2-dehydro-3-deoxygluconokinase